MITRYMDGVVMVETIAYGDNGSPLEGYLAHFPGSSSETAPAVAILLDWDGVNGPIGYETERVIMMAQKGGYVAMVADVYGVEYTDATKYRSDPELFVIVYRVV